MDSREGSPWYTGTAPPCPRAPLLQQSRASVNWRVLSCTRGLLIPAAGGAGCPLRRCLSGRARCVAGAGRGRSPGLPGSEETGSAIAGAGLAHAQDAASRGGGRALPRACAVRRRRAPCWRAGLRGGGERSGLPRSLPVSARGPGDRGRAGPPLAP